MKPKNLMEIVLLMPGNQAPLMVEHDKLESTLEYIRQAVRANPEGVQGWLVLRDGTGICVEVRCAAVYGWLVRRADDNLQAKVAEQNERLLKLRERELNDMQHGDDWKGELGG